MCKCPDPNKACECKSECTSQDPGFDYPVVLSLNNFPFGLFGAKFKDCPNQTGGGLEGHANWVPVTMSGQLVWSTDQPIDEDADIYLIRPLDADKCDFSAYTSEWREHVEVEAAEYETFDSFWTSGWYYGFQFHKPGDLLSNDAIVVGLFSIDCVHSCKAELHPAYAIAARISESPLFHDGIWDDYWAIFARNYGNEGWCSHNDHPLDLQRIILSLPAPEGATSVSVIANDTNFFNSDHVPGTPPTRDEENTEFRANVGRSDVEKIRMAVSGLMGNEVRVAFAFPQDSPQVQSVNSHRAQVDGLLHLRWHTTLTAPPPVSPKRKDCGWASRTEKDWPFDTEKPPCNDSQCKTVRELPARSSQSGESFPVIVTSYSEIVATPFSNPTRIAMVSPDASTRKNTKQLKQLIKKHCKTGQPCKEDQY